VLRYLLHDPDPTEIYTLSLHDALPISLVEQALRDYRQVKNATTRGDVVKYFVPDGGLQFPAKTRYVHPRCEYLHVDVEFELVKRSEEHTSELQSRFDLVCRLLLEKKKQ